MIGRDPRASGEMLEAAVIAGLTSEGVDALRVGVLPTPAVAYLTGAYDADFGVMISASHNPMPDNGIKIFGPGGHKLDDATEDRIEELVGAGPGMRPVGAAIGRVVDAEDAVERYLRHARQGRHHPLDGLTVVVDCAHGAASHAAPACLPGGGRRGHRDKRRAQRPEHQRRRAARRTCDVARGGGVLRRRPRPGPRRRRRPLSGRRRHGTCHRRRRDHGGAARWPCRRRVSWPPTPWSPR